jgi:DNA gyrase subunit A
MKKTAIKDLPGPSAQTFTICRVNDGDTLGWCLVTNGKQQILLGTEKGMCIRFSEEDIRPMGLVAAGVNGIKLSIGDEVIGVGLAEKGKEVILIGSDGKGKRNKIEDYPSQSRYGQGVIAWRTSAGNRLAGMLVISKEGQIIVEMSKSASRQVKGVDVTATSRAGIPKSLIDVKAGDSVIGVLAPQDMLSTWGMNEPGLTGETKLISRKKKILQTTLPGLDGGEKNSKGQKSTKSNARSGSKSTKKSKPARKKGGKYNST